MLEFFRQRMLKHLASVSLAAGCGMLDPSVALADIPAPLVTELLDDTVDSDWRDEDRGAVFDLLIKDPRASVRCAIARAAVSADAPPNRNAQPLLRTLAADGAWAVREAAAEALALWLQRAPVTSRVPTMCQWALAEAEPERLAIARALARPIDVPAADIALGSLAGDSSPAVRCAAVNAIGQRWWCDASFAGEIAADALRDQDRRVRRAAKKLMRRLSGASSRRIPP